MFGIKQEYVRCITFRVDQSPSERVAEVLEHRHVRVCQHTRVVGRSDLYRQLRKSNVVGVGDLVFASPPIMIGETAKATQSDSTVAKNDRLNARRQHGQFGDTSRPQQGFQTGWDPPPKTSKIAIYSRISTT